MGVDSLDGHGHKLEAPNCRVLAADHPANALRAGSLGCSVGQG